MSYNPRSGNPFAANDPNKEWTNNSLILQDPNLRAKSGVATLDSNVAELYGNQAGGAAAGAPFHQQYPESDKAKPWNLPPYNGPLNKNQAVHEQEHARVDQMGGMAYHYYNNNQRW